jgi:metal-sulfur cluster biosynthetic enzyme
MTTQEAVLDALAGVRDPELDEPLTELGFVSGVDVEGGAVRVRLRLPTYFCAPNFAFMMAADARAAVLALPGVEEAVVSLGDHFSSGEINDAVRNGRDFADAFPGQADGDLASLRDLFARKAFLARQARLCNELLAAGPTLSELAAMRVAELPDTPEAEQYLARRRELGLDVSAGAPAIVNADGRAVDAATLPRYLRVARLVRVSVEGNGGLCRSLLETRYGGDSAVCGERR